MTKLEIILARVATGTIGEVTFDVRDYSEEDKVKIESTARAMGLDVSGCGEFILVRPSLA